MEFATVMQRLATCLAAKTDIKPQKEKGENSVSPLEATFERALGPRQITSWQERLLSSCLFSCRLSWLQLFSQL